jgi:peptide/nickel transport system substrate-binding protein
MRLGDDGRNGSGLISRRRLLQGAGAGLLAGPVLSAPVRAQASDRLVFALSSFPPSLRPWANTGTAALTVKWQSLRGLLGYDAKGEVRGELAESWTRESPTVWTFKLRQGAKFHDGEPVTPDAVRASFALIADQKSSAYFRARIQALVDKIEAPDASTVKFILKEPAATWPLILASPHMPIISPKSTEAKPAGAGPYMITDQERGTRIDLEAFPGYYRPGKPLMKKLRFAVYQDESLRVAALDAGDVDIAEYVPWQNMGAVEKSDKLTLDAVDGPFMYLVFNTKAGPFTNAKLRQAVAYAVDREAIVKGAFIGRGSVLGGLPFFSSGKFADPAISNHFKLDVAKAKALLAEGGQPNGFKTTLLSSATYGMHKDTAEVVQQSLKAIGIDVTLAIPDWATRVSLGNKGQYEFGVMGTAGDYDDPDALSSLLGGGQTGSYARPFGYNNPRVNELLDKGRAEYDIDKRKAIYKELAEVSYEDSVFIGLALRSQGYGLKKSVAGFKNLPGMLTFFSGITLEDTKLG